jgi:hypothetical protein
MSIVLLVPLRALPEVSDLQNPMQVQAKAAILWRLPLVKPVRLVWTFGVAPRLITCVPPTTQANVHPMKRRRRGVQPTRMFPKQGQSGQQRLATGEGGQVGIEITPLTRSAIDVYRLHRYPIWDPTIWTRWSQQWQVYDHRRLYTTWMKSPRP